MVCVAMSTLPFLLSRHGLSVYLVSGGSVSIVAGPHYRLVMLPRRPMRDYDRARPVAYFSCARWRCAIEQLLVSTPRRLSPILGFLRFSRPSHQDLGPRPSSRDLGTMASWRYMSERVKTVWRPRSPASLFVSGFAENVKQTLQ